MFVAASTRCFPDVPLAKSLSLLADLEFSAAEIVVGSGKSDVRPEWIANNFQDVCRLCLSNRQISPSIFLLDAPADDPRFLAKFELTLRLAKALRAVTVVVKSSPFGFPYNEEFERLQKLARFGVNFGVGVATLTERDAISGSVDSLRSVCKNIPELSVALDPSEFIFGYERPVDYEPLIPYVAHTRLRDTNAQKYQTQIGQGILEYNRLITQLQKTGYKRALCVDLAPTPGLDPESELRKMRLLLESAL